MHICGFNLGSGLAASHWLHFGKYLGQRDDHIKLGLLLPNQGVVFGATTVPELLELAENAENAKGSGVFESL
jgi:hypothetical protein